MTLPAGSYAYAVTALDGIGGETQPVLLPTVTTTTPTNITINWIGVPNAFAYNVYRSTPGTGFELLSTGSMPATCGGPPQSLPVSNQCVTIPPIPNTNGGKPLFSYVDDGTAVPIAPIVVSPGANVVIRPNEGNLVDFTVPSTANIPVGQAFTVSGITDNPILNGVYIVIATSATTITGEATFNIPSMGSSTSGATLGFAPLAEDTTEQTELLKIPGDNPPVSYGPPNVIAVFPPPIQRLGVSAVAGNAQVGASEQLMQQQTATIGQNGLMPFNVQIFGAVYANPSGVPVTEITFTGNLPAPVNVGDHVRITGTANFNGFYTVQTTNPGSTGAALNSLLLLPAVAPGTSENPAAGFMQFELVVVSLTSLYNAPTGSRQTISGSTSTPPNNFNGTFTVRSGGASVLGLVLQVPGADAATANGSGGQITPAGGVSTAGVSAAAGTAALFTPRYARLTQGETITFPPADPLVNIDVANVGLVPFVLKVVSIGESTNSTPPYTFITFPANAPLPEGLRASGSGNSDQLRVTGTPNYGGQTYTIIGGNGVVVTAAAGTPIPTTSPTGIPTLYCRETHGFATQSASTTPPISGQAIATFCLTRMNYTPPTLFPADFIGVLQGAKNPSYDATFHQVRANNPAGVVGNPTALNLNVPNAFLFGASGSPNPPAQPATYGTGGSTGGGGGPTPSPPPPPSPPVSGAEAATINGGIVGLLSPVPQMLQFTNRMILAMGNGYPPQYVPDGTGTAVNPAIQYQASVSIPAGNQEAYGALATITLTNNPDPNGVNPLTPGTQFLLTAPTSSEPDFSVVGQIIAVQPAPAFTNPNPPPPTITNAPGNTFTAWLLINPSTQIPTGGPGFIVTQTVAPLPNNYVVNFPVWQPNISVAVGDLYQPATQPASSCVGGPPGTIGGTGGGNGGVYIRCTQAGITSAPEPHWPDPCATKPSPGTFPIKNIVEKGTPGTPPTAISGTAAPTSGQVIWEEVGWINGPNGVAPAPPGAAHEAVYSDCLFLFNTYPHQTGNATTGWGIDGPTALRQSDVNNPFSWNPINQSFVDKDDGFEGMGLGTFTIAAVGITPVGSLFLYKNFSSYQFTGLFQAGANLARIRTDRGCTAPRTIRFFPGLGESRLTHLGISVTDGVSDQIISDAVRPYLFATNDRSSSDIQFMDPVWAPFSYADMTANPPMYCCAIPVGEKGNSLGALTRALCFDVGQQGWYPIDFPFSISLIKQVLVTPQAAITFLGGWDDGLIQRWQYGDMLWLTNGPAPMQVAWFYRTPLTASANPDQRVFAQQVVFKGIDSHNLGPMFTEISVDGFKIPQRPNYTQFVSHNFWSVSTIMRTGNKFHAILSGTGGVEISGDDFHIVPKPIAGRLIVA
jgi:hypothetical protein